MTATPPDRCFQIFRQTIGAMYAGMTTIESAKAIQGRLPDVLAILMLKRGLTTFEAISATARQGKVVEAMILGRPLFEESVLLDDAAQRSEEKHDARIVWHQHASWAEWRDSLRRLAPEDLQGRDVDDLVADAHAEMKILEAYADEHGLSKKPGKLAVRAAAQELGRDRECVAYDISDQLLRFRAVSLVGRSKQVDDGKISVKLRDEHSDELLPLLTFWTASSILRAFIATATTMGWAIPEQMDDLLKYLQRMKLFD